MSINKACKISYGVRIPVGEVDNKEENINNAIIIITVSKKTLVALIMCQVLLLSVLLRIYLVSQLPYEVVCLLHMRRLRHREAK